MSSIVGYCVVSEQEEMIGCTSNYRTASNLVSVICTGCANEDDKDNMEPVFHNDCHDTCDLCYQAVCDVCRQSLA